MNCRKQWIFHLTLILVQCLHTYLHTYPPTQAEVWGSLTKLWQKCCSELAHERKYCLVLLCVRSNESITHAQRSVWLKKKSPLQNCLLGKHLQFLGFFLREDSEDSTVQNWDISYEEKGQGVQSSCWKTLFSEIGFNRCLEIIITQMDVLVFCSPFLLETDNDTFAEKRDREENGQNCLSTLWHKDETWVKLCDPVC